MKPISESIRIQDNIKNLIICVWVGEVAAHEGEIYNLKIEIIVETTTSRINEVGIFTNFELVIDNLII